MFGSHAVLIFMFPEVAVALCGESFDRAQTIRAKCEVKSEFSFTLSFRLLWLRSENIRLYETTAVEWHSYSIKGFKQY